MNGVVLKIVNGQPSVSDEHGNIMRGVKRITCDVSKGARSVEVHLDMIGPSKTFELRSDAPVFVMAHPETGEFKPIRRIVFDDGSEWNASP